MEDNYTIKTSRPVLEINTFIKYECDQFKLIGYIDGIVENEAMETENRRRIWKEPHDVPFQETTLEIDLLHNISFNYEGVYEGKNIYAVCFP